MSCDHPACTFGLGDRAPLAVAWPWYMRHLLPVSGLLPEDHREAIAGVRFYEIDGHAWAEVEFELEERAIVVRLPRELLEWLVEHWGGPLAAGGGA